MASALNGASANNSLSQAPGSRTTARQTRTNPSRVSKTAARSFPYYGSQHGQSSTNDGAGQSAANNIPHGLFPALTHFTDAITALPREFRRHNSLLKEVDAKAWALEDNLHQLLLSASDSRPVPFPQNPAPIVDGEVREYAHTLVSLYSMYSCVFVSVRADWLSPERCPKCRVARKQTASVAVRSNQTHSV